MVYLFVYWLCCTACGVLVPWPGIEPVPHAVEAWSPDHWATSELPRLCMLKCIIWLFLAHVYTHKIITTEIDHEHTYYSQSFLLSVLSIPSLILGNHWSALGYYRFSRVFKYNHTLYSLLLLRYNLQFYWDIIYIP